MLGSSHRKMLKSGGPATDRRLFAVIPDCPHGLRVEIGPFASSRRLRHRARSMRNKRLAASCATALPDYAENKAFLVEPPPEPVLLPAIVMRHRRGTICRPGVGSPTDAVDELAPELQAQLANRLVCDRSSASSQHLLDHVKAQTGSLIDVGNSIRCTSRIACAGETSLDCRHRVLGCAGPWTRLRL
jgi:hypothetical protein